jgi:hypothetical protein
MQFNKDTFIKNCMRDVRIEGFDKWADGFHQYIKYFTYTNSMDGNISIINENGGFYYAVLAHLNDIGPLEYSNEIHFYAVLAYAILLETYYSEIETLVKKEIEDKNE